MPEFYRITVERVGPGYYALFNEASGSFCGDRMRKGETEKLAWPFRKVKWWQWDTLKEAEKAAKLLQDYLDKYEGKKAKPKKGEE